MNRDELIELHKDTSKAVCNSETILHEAVQQMAEHQLDPATVTLTFLLHGFNYLEQATPEVQFNALQMAEYKIALHRKRLAKERLLFNEDEMWEEVSILAQEL